MQRRILFNHNRAMRQVWISRLVTLLVWLAVGLSAAYWLLRWQGGQNVASQAQVAVGAAFAADPQQIAKFLGAVENTPVAIAAPPMVSSRFGLVGIAKAAVDRSVALISIDGKPPKQFRIGAVVESGLVLKSVSSRSVELAPAVGAPASFKLEFAAQR